MKNKKLCEKGQGNSNDIFKKGRADHLPHKRDLRTTFKAPKDPS